MVVAVLDIQCGLLMVLLSCCLPIVAPVSLMVVILPFPFSFFPFFLVGGRLLGCWLTQPELG
jgi:hypothetical protein